MEWIIVIPIIYLFLLLGLGLEAHSMRTLSWDYIDREDQMSFAVIVNYRNEHLRLPTLLESIKFLDYDFEKVDFYFMNDGSNDGSESLLKEFKQSYPHIKIHLLDRVPLSVSAKKDGIQQAVELITSQFIISTDADCVLPSNWLKCYHLFYSRYPKAHFVSGPVSIQSSNSFLQTIQNHEMVALQVMTMGAFQIKRPFMANGANMSFKKKAFEKVRGYEGNTHISSGDDVFLLEKLWQLDSEHCHYLKNAAASVTTFSKHNWKNMIAQRARWAQKGSETSSLLNKAIGFQVLVMSLLFLTAPVLFLSDLITFPLFIGILIIKVLTDVLVLFIGNQFFQQSKWTQYLLLQLLVYPVVVIGVALASLSKPQWSNRKINQLEVQD
ncbi:hypothetical protein BST97_09580 [Nonlabens spongiae]|uniref:Glycosyltransferase 2-like domain-containing protein n=1 Tax=Nonlabens spongiae TaxID=331648 RepID=A0A1W6MKT7_9FLAO|nr:glycosyltransferase [Nonlabens spongiae]ARN78221.1 hypothetical protein BST97_09580 [Nonlabens spongiae]